MTASGCCAPTRICRRELEQRLERSGTRCEWADVIRDLDALEEIELQLDGKRYRLRSVAKGTTGKVFQACGVARPPVLRPYRQHKP